MVGGHPDIDKVQCRLNAFDEHGIELYTEYHVHSFSDRWRVITEIHLAIMRMFEENELRFALPVRILHEDRAAGSASELPATAPPLAE